MVEWPYLRMSSIGTKVFTWVSLSLCSFAMGSPFQGRGSIPVYVLDLNEGFPLGLSGIVFLHDGATLLGSNVHTFVCTRSDRRFSLELFWVSSSFAMGSPCRVVYLFFVRPRSFQWNSLLLAAASLPCLPHGTRQWTVIFCPHLLLRIEFQFCWL